MTLATIELQKKALDKSVATTDLLREALAIAKKLKISDIQPWLKAELNGYSQSEGIPSYREIRGELRAWNPFHGWQPFLIEDPELEEILSKRFCNQSISEIENFASKQKQGPIAFPFPSEIILRLMQRSNFFSPPTLHISEANLYRIIDTVRTRILEWALDLEEKGILGEGFTFSEEEKKNTAQVTFNMGQMSHSQIQTQTHPPISQMQNSTVDSTQSINHPVTLSDKDWKTFYENLVNPPEPTPSLKTAFQEYCKSKKKNV